MSLDYWDGFDEYANTTDAGMFGWVGGGYGNAGRVAGSCLRLNNSNATLSNAGVVAGTRQTIGVAWRTSNPSAIGAIMQWREGGSTEHGRITYNGNGTFTISRAGAAITFGVGSATTSAVTPGTAVWNYLEWDFTCDNTAGAWEFRFNGVTIGSGSSGDTQNGGTGALSVLLLQGPNGPNSDYDDLYIASGSTSFQGDCRVMSAPPNGAGNYAQWTPNASTNISRVNQTTQDGDTTYNSDATSGHRDSFGFAALGVTGTVLGLISLVIARKDDAGARNLKVSIRQGGTDYDGGSVALGASYTGIWRTDLTDPNSGSAWTVGGVNSAELGYLDV